MSTHLTTPFGRRSQPLGLIATQIQTRAFANQSKANQVVHKWRLFRALSESAGAFGVSDRTLTVLYALLGLHPETALTLNAENPTIIVFPSSRELETRANSMPASTLRRHLTALVHARLIIRRDSPNGKRYARKGQDGQIEQAFGFDLAPFVMRANEIMAAAQAKKDEDKKRALLRERITIHRRNIGGLIDTGLTAAVVGPWPTYVGRLAAIGRQPIRNAATGTLEEICEALASIQQEIEALLAAATAADTTMESGNMSTNDSHNERHLQIQPQKDSDIEPTFQKGGAEPSVPKSETSVFPIPVLVSAFPDALDYAPDGIRRAGDVIDVAERIRPLLGISPAAWNDARQIMGPADASISILAILQRAEAINSPGGYLRALTAKKRAGGFTIGPIVMSQLRTNLKKRAAKSA